MTGRLHVGVTSVTASDTRDGACDRRVEDALIRRSFDKGQGHHYHCQMASSFDLQEELQALQDIVNYPIEHEHDIGSMEPAEMDGLLRRTQFLFRLTEEEKVFKADR